MRISIYIQILYIFYSELPEFGRNISTVKSVDKEKITRSLYTYMYIMYNVNAVIELTIEQWNGMKKLISVRREPPTYK